MLPAGETTEEAVRGLGQKLLGGDVLVDGGNSRYTDTIRRAGWLEAQEINFLDVGTSGGIWGEKNGFSLMVGGPKEAVARLKPIFETLAPAPDQGFGHVGPAGMGHYVKMVHNGIEYGVMQAFAEGFALLESKNTLGLDLAEIGKIWQQGSVIRSWLLDLIVRALEENPGLGGIAPFVQDSGEGRWTVEEAINQNVACPVITLALLERISSRERDAFQHKLLAAMRQQFGGHDIEKARSLPVRGR
jgi:6-phosphogluconate dehydrogenase